MSGHCKQRSSTQCPAGLARNGFTLIELVMVMAIITMVSGMVLPRYAKALTRYRAKAAARRIIDDLALAQGEARHRSRALVVTFDTINHEYTITDAATGDDVLGSGAVDLTAEPYGAKITSANFAGNATVTFDGYGQPSSGGTVVVSVGDDTATVLLDAQTGRASLQ